MAHRIKANDDQCCPCAEREGCSCGAPCNTIECRARGGTATLVGFSEFTAPSLPPKKYLTMAFGGSMTATGYNNSNCTGTPTGTVTESVSGSCTVDAVTGVVTNGTNVHHVPSSGAPSDYQIGCAALGGICGIPATLTATSEVRTGDGTCCQTSSSGWTSYDGTTTVTLTDEDTESAAIARLLAGSGGDWDFFGGWRTVGDGTGSTCVPTDCCKSSWEPRGAGEFTFGYQEAQYRVTSTGNTPGWSVNLRLRFFRKPWGAPDTSYTLFAEETLSLTADIDGIATSTGDVPIQQGYDTYLAACVRINT